MIWADDVADAAPTGANGFRVVRLVILEGQRAALCRYASRGFERESDPTTIAACRALVDALEAPP